MVQIKSLTDGVTLTETSTFAMLLRVYRDRAGLSRNRMARAAGVDASYLTRIEHDDRDPPRRQVIEALARVLRLTTEETGRLLLAAGYAGPTLLRYGVWDSSLESLIGALCDPLLEPSERDELATILRQVAARYQQLAELRARSERRNGAVH